jgi:hypothetical protein
MDFEHSSRRRLSRSSNNSRVTTTLTQQEKIFNYVTGVINKPSTDSFVPFFREWFRTEWYPEIAEEMHVRMDQRFQEESRQSILGTLRTAAAAMIMQSTKSAHCELACTAVLSQSGVTFREFTLGTWAELTIDSNRTGGSRSRSGRRTRTKVHFVGVNGTWYALPRWLNRGLDGFHLEGLVGDIARQVKNEIESDGATLLNTGLLSQPGSTKRRSKRSGSSRR